MKSFTDSEGREWSINMTIGAVKRVRQLLRVNLFDPLGIGAKKPIAKGGKIKKARPLVTRLQLDVALLVDVIFALVKPVADERGVTDVEFGEALGGDAAYQAYQVFMAEWRDFFQRLRRETEAKAIAANMEMVAAEDKRNVLLVDRATEAAERVTARQRQKAIEKIESLGRSETATSSQESSGDSTSGPSTP